MASFLDFLNKDKVSLSNRIYIYPDIPREKAVNAIRKMSDGVAVYYEDVRVLIDTTLLGSGKSGVMITDTHIFLRADFDNPICRSVDDIFSIEAKKSLFGLPIIYINDKKILKLENMDSPPVEYIIQCFSNYIEYLDEEPDEELDDDEAEALLEEILKELPPEKREITGELLRQGRLAKSQEEVDKLKEVMELYVESLESNDSEVKKLISGYKSASSTKEKDLLIDMMKRNIQSMDNDESYIENENNSVLKYYPMDNIISIYRSVRSTEAKLVLGAINFFNTDPSSELKGVVAKCILDNTIYIREIYFENRRIRNLLNDAAVFETTLYITALIWNELGNRGFDDKIIKYILSEGINDMFTDKFYSQFPKFASNVISISEENLIMFATEDKEILRMVYYARLVLSNLLGRSGWKLTDQIENIMNAMQNEDSPFYVLSDKIEEALHKAKERVEQIQQNNPNAINNELFILVYIMQFILADISDVLKNEMKFDLLEDRKLHYNIQSSCSEMVDLIKKIR